MDYPTRVGVGDRVAGRHEMTQELAKGKAVGRRVIAFRCLFERGTFDEAHGVRGPTLLVLEHPVDGNDARVFQPSGHLGLNQEATDETKSRYAFVYGDFRRVHRTGLIACQYRAAEWRHKEIELAAHELLQRLDKTSA